MDFGHPVRAQPQYTEISFQADWSVWQCPSFHKGCAVSGGHHLSTYHTQTA